MEKALVQGWVRGQSGKGKREANTSIWDTEAVLATTHMSKELVNPLAWQERKVCVKGLGRTLVEKKFGARVWKTEH